MRITVGIFLRFIQFQSTYFQTRMIAAGRLIGTRRQSVYRQWCRDLDISILPLTVTTAMTRGGDSSCNQTWYFVSTSAASDKAIAEKGSPVNQRVAKKKRKKVSTVLFSEQDKTFRELKARVIALRARELSILAGETKFLIVFD